jgi:phosphatidylglycerol---prolipoprotein diacylglyceryl transferase
VWTTYYLIRPYPVWRFLDCAAPGLALGLFFGRLGCLMAGCNGGVVSDAPWALRFPQGTAVYRRQAGAGLVEGWEPLSLPVHPTQFYESLFGLAAFILLLALFPRYRGTGRIFFTGLLTYSVYRFLTEYLRADAGGLQPFGFLTFAQLISLLLFLSLTAVLFGRAGAPRGDFDSPPPPLPACPVPPPRKSASKLAALQSRPRRGRSVPARPDLEIE